MIAHVLGRVGSIRMLGTNRSATNRSAIVACNQKDKPTISDVVWMKAVKRDAWISTMQVVIKGTNEVNGIL